MKYLGLFAMNFIAERISEFFWSGSVFTDLHGCFVAAWATGSTLLLVWLIGGIRP